MRGVAKNGIETTSFVELTPRSGTGPSRAANGLGTVVAALFGSCFPTTVYIGHPGWKALGARAGYSAWSPST